MNYSKEFMNDLLDGIESDNYFSFLILGHFEPRSIADLIAAVVGLKSFGVETVGNVMVLMDSRLIFITQFLSRRKR